MVQISLKESKRYFALGKSMQVEATAKVKKGMKFMELKVWAKDRKSPIIG